MKAAISICIALNMNTRLIMFAPAIIFRFALSFPVCALPNSAGALILLADAGETENARLSYDEKQSGRGVVHKVNAHAIADNYETLDLFITIFHGDDAVSNLSKTDVDLAANRVTKFFRTAVYKDYTTEIESSSEIFDLAHTLANAPEIKENLVRVNICILTDSIFTGSIPATQTIAGYPLYFRVVDLGYLYNLSEKCSTMLLQNWTVFILKM